MKKFIARMRQEKTPHERRQFSMQVAGVITALLFVGWLGTLGARLVGSGAAPAAENTAATLQAVSSTSTMLPSAYPGYYGNR